MKLQKDLDFSLVVAHLDHGFRGRVSQEDALWVEKLAESYGLICYRKFIDVPAWKKHLKQSSQMAARTLRYQFFQELKEQINFDKVALAHHLDDQAETVLNNLLRGAGISGIKGILPQRDFYIRPLLELTRLQIAAYAQQKGLEHREDASNQKTIYVRNKLRWDLLPFLKQYNPEITKALGHLAEIAAAEDHYLEEQAAAGRQLLDLTLPKDQGQKVVLDWEGLKKLDLALQRRILRRAYAELSGGQVLAREQLEKALALDSAANGRASWPANLLVRRFQGHLEIFRPVREVPEYNYQLKVPGRLWIPEIACWLEARILSRQEAGDPKLRSRQEALLDSAGIDDFLEVRNRRQGDWFWPLGRTDPTRLKKFFSGQKIATEERNKLPLILAKGEIIWIGGVIPGEKYKLTERTEKCIELKIQPRESVNFTCRDCSC
ncbi:MAG: tRNA lysidine(34) synthetase TilS [Clostridia bacterium]|nr:tRNA lysidine(34) synthetase TilS [Clostridia bacterium]